MRWPSSSASSSNSASAASRLEQARIATHLAQAQQLRERRQPHLPLRLAGALEARQFVFGRGAHGLVHLALRRGQLDEHDLFDLRRQLRRDLQFRAPQDVRRRLPAHARLVPRALVAARFRRNRLEVTGQDDGEQRLEIGEAVFHRRAGEHQTTARAQRLQRLRVLRAAILHVLRLVGHQHVPLDRLEQRLVARERAVGSDHEIGAAQRRRLFRAARAVMHQHAQLRRETRGLAPPVLEQ